MLARPGGAIVIVALLAYCGCAPVPPPADGQRAGIGIAVSVRAPIPIFRPPVARVYFVRVDAGPGGYLQPTVLPSNFGRGGQFYLLDVAPGQYAAVAAWWPAQTPGQGGTFVNLFPRDVVKRTDTTVAPGTVQFMGEYVLDSSVRTAGDDLQRHYGSVLGPIVRSGATSYVGALHEAKRDRESERRFLDAALGHLGDAGWAAAVRTSLERAK